jgi:hemerythrin-like domain-containing protein
MVDPLALANLREDHANAARLLDLLDLEARAVRSGDDADYDVIEGVIDYFKGYPDAFHHPLEDQIFNRLSEADPIRAKAIGDLLAEHEAIRKETVDLAAALDSVRLEAEVPRNNIVEKIEAFVAMYRGHMMAEDARFFPVAAAVLGDTDWEAIRQNVNEHDDLLFRSKEGFEGLRKRLLAFEDNL